MNYTQLYWAVLIKCIHIILHLSKMHTYYSKMHAYYSTCNCIHMYAYLHAIVIIPTRLYTFFTMNIYHGTPKRM